MILEGELANCGKHPELLEVIAKYGDRAAVFVWENKGALAVGATLTAGAATWRCARSTKNCGSAKSGGRD